MKTFVLVIFLIIVDVLTAFGFCGELTFYVDDNSSSNYKIIASRYSLSDPIFGDNKMMLETEDYDNVVSSEKDFEVDEPFDFYLGFDYEEDHGSYCWPFIGIGKYIITIYRDNIAVKAFKIDLLDEPAVSPDIRFEFTYTTNILIAKTTEGGEDTISNNQWVYVWVLKNKTRDISPWENPVLVTNSRNGIVNENIETTLESAYYGFPYTEYQYTPGSVFITGEEIYFWRGAKYGISVSPIQYTDGGVNYKFRNWDIYNDYEPSTNLRVLSETDAFRSMYYPTLPLTVTNNLEGGNGGSYQIEWQTYGGYTDPISSGVSYNAFQYTQQLQDLYNLKINGQFNALNTSWNFIKLGK